MSSLTHEGPAAGRPSISWRDAVDVWASLAIGVVWLAVSITAIFGPDMRFQGADGSGSVIPSAVAVALFAVFATASIAKRAFGRER